MALSLTHHEGASWGGAYSRLVVTLPSVAGDERWASERAEEARREAVLSIVA
jgi:hypothetical protein